MLRLIGATLLAGIVPAAMAATTDIAAQPLATLPTVQAKPNLLFILDNSGSMGNAYMPDEMNSNGRYGYWSSQCNGVAFDETLSYAPPVNADGTSFPNATFTSAWSDGYAQSGSDNLNNNTYYVYSGTQPAMGWTYSKSDGNVDSSTTFYKECQSGLGKTPGSNVFTLKTITTSDTAALKQKYANWYAYYRTRRLLMRTAAGKALQVLGSGYRVGFTTISNTGVTNNGGFQEVLDFDATQKATFYTKLYAASGSGTTPLRGALSKAGRYFAKQVPGQTTDPVQYSCQRNYALLSTDGYWNTGSENSSYGAFKLDGSTAVGQQDGAEDRPMRDGTYTQKTAVTPTTSVELQNVVTVSTTPTPWTRYVWGVAKTTSTCSGTANRYAVSRITQTRTESVESTKTVVNRLTTTSTRTVITRDDVLISDSTSTGNTTTQQVSSTTAQTGDTYSGWVTSATSADSCLTATNLNNFGLTAGSTYYTNSNTVNASATKTTDNTYAGTSGRAGTVAVVGPTTTSQGTTVTTGDTTTTVVNATGVADTLADVAEYYYNTDLRTSALGNCRSGSSGEDTCSNNLKGAGRDSATWQHMTTFTIGLGVNGTLAYDRNYLAQATGDYINLVKGIVSWPTPEVSSNGGDARNIDDLWHAAVNGRGQYYSALNAAALAEAITGVVNTIQEVHGSASSASTSALELVAGDNNQVYKASYTTKSWTGDLEAYTLNGTDATIGTTPLWSAQALLDAAAPTSRKIYYKQPSTTTLRAFNWTNLNTDGYGARFSNLCTQAVVASQCASLSTADKNAANTGEKLVDYLRGVRTFEAASTTNSTTAALYRKRTHVLGDIINGAPVYVGKPPFSYADAGYAAFVTSKATRKPVVYVAANDGMLHAFSAGSSDGGTELWSYVPSHVIPNLYKLADASYESKHQYYVDGAPVMADIKVGSTWKTILVGGLNSGGNGYYALDITDPENPLALWEFTNANMGLTYGNPVVTKQADGTWVVAFTSGYNNTGGDGLGHLYVVNASTGALIHDLPTTAGSAASPSGLSKINAWIDVTSDNTTKRFYGGDLQGNLWRFDIDNLVLPHQSAMLLAKFQVDASTLQPITTKPETAEVDGKPIIVVATGRYLGASDVEDTTQQTIYAVKDNLTDAGWGDVRADTTNMVRQTLTATGTTATITNNPVNWSNKGGWWVDLPHSRERVSTNMGLQFSTLAIVSAIPSGDACASGGSSWRYYLNVTNGGVLTTTAVGTQWSSDALVVGLGWVKLSNGNVRVLIQDSTGKVTPDTPPTTSSSGAGSVRRTSWRELTD
ncbi:Type IV pilus biogenesis factor PilY1 [Variovorax paradoxus]|uniref:Type IV pilus biogenesis factor PilY1 n=2 Tax=Variovorax paradoxus TaxID=34073 RepID=A0A679IVZ4_VARPD|nr:Type IV pilus biogenesis factor PilY1 [Variovorax paradoxus]